MNKIFTLRYQHPSGCFFYGTFNLPRSHDARSLVGANLSSVGYQDNGQLPNIKGEINSWANYGAAYNESALYAGSRSGWGAASGSSYPHDENIFFDASRYNNIYDSNATAVLPRRLQVLHCIKYI